ncbi:hypothetical protein PRK78_000100 [Emydomyces testavorans]|uniref:Aminoglycoside phosphotransferase domain-containing protein n=1 Tax=Emydomyces testavorans TaxID=2070801 RepID=A0AAF0DAI5_9EURO|nr:hypothetical protein PRK78_000100 [Emydomyces testavorans]
MRGICPLTNQQVDKCTSPLANSAQEEDEENKQLLVELASAVVKSLDRANEVVNVEFLARGGYNHLWTVTFSKVRHKLLDISLLLRLLTSKKQNQNDKCTQSGISETQLHKLVLRLPRRVPSLQPFQLRNEVAFLTYISQKLPNIPVPKVYAYEDGTNPGTVPYIAEEFIDGSKLEDVWFELSNDKKQSLCQRIASIVVDLAETRFSVIGSLSLDFHPGPTVQGVKIFKGRYKFHSSEIYDVGPYFKSKDFILAAYDREIYYYTHGGDDIEMDFFTKTPLPNWIEHLKTEREAIAAGEKDDVCKLIDEEPFCISHGDFSTSNILVRDGNVVGVVDWEFAGMYPLSEILGPIDIISLAEKHYRFDSDAAEEEMEKWNKQVLEDIEAIARQRGWAEKNVKVLMGDSHDIFSTAQFEMFPRDWMME